MSFTDFVWRGVSLRVRRVGRDEAVAGASNAAGRAGRGRVSAGDSGAGSAWAAQVRLLEPVQHEDVAEGPQADAPQEASLGC